MLEFLENLGLTPNPKCLVFSAITVLGYYSLPVCQNSVTQQPDAGRAATTFVVSAGLVKMYHHYYKCKAAYDFSYALGLLTTALYMYLPCRFEQWGHRTALLIAGLSYVGMAWYDHNMGCDRKLRANPLSIFKSVKPPAIGGYYT